LFVLFEGLSRDESSECATSTATGDTGGAYYAE
jgi:hypothetical protein